MATIATLDVQFRSLGSAVLMGDVSAIGSALLDVAQTAVNTALELNEIEQVFRKLIPSSEEAAAAIEGIRKVAEGSDFGFESLEKTAGVLLRMKVPGDQVVDTMNAIVNAVGAVEGTEQDIDTVAAAIGRMNSTGEVTQRVLRQIQLAGVDAYGILRTELGLTQDEIEHISDQNLDASEVNNALLKGMFEATAVGTESAADKTAQELKNMQDNVKKLYEAFGKEILPLMMPAIEQINIALVNVTTHAKEIVGFLQFAADQINQLSGGGSAPVVGIGPNTPGAPRPKNWVGPWPPVATGSSGGAGGGNSGTVGPPAPPGYKPPELKAVEELDDLGQALSDTERELELILKDNAEAVKETTAALGGGAGGGNTSGEGLRGASNRAAQAQEQLAKLNAAGFKTAEQLGIKLDSLTTSTFTYETSLKDLDAAIKSLSMSFMVDKEVIDKLFPSLEGANDLFQQMNEGLREITFGTHLAGSGAQGGNVLQAFKTLAAMQEANLHLLQVIEATGMGAQTAGNQFDELTAKMPGMSTAFDDLLASFTHHAAATNAVADSMQVVAEQQLVSVSAGMAGAQAAASAVNTGLAQLGAGLGVYGQMAATGQLPGGLPGGNPFSQTGNPLGYGGGLSGGTSGGSITNPFAPGTPWGGGQHGFPPGGSGNWGGGVIIMTVDGREFGRVASTQNQWTAFNNSVGMRSG